MDTIATRPEVNGGVKSQRCPFPAQLPGGQLHFPMKIPDDDFRRFCRRAWARLIGKVYLADPLTCPKCGGSLRIISFIDNPSVTEKILRHLKARVHPNDPPRLQPQWNLGMIFSPGRRRPDV